MSQKGRSPILIVLLIAVALAGYLIYQNQTKPAPPQQITNPSSTPTQQATPSPQNNTSVSSSVENGADLENIKYTLPSGWRTEIIKNGGKRTLRISPDISSGSELLGIYIHAYDYPNNTGRREYYCKITNYCIEGTTYYTQMQIGNISGYEANALDNSGGGSEYFGAKGNKFYIISKIRDITTTSDEFGKHFKEVLNSLVF